MIEEKLYTEDQTLYLINKRFPNLALSKADFLIMLKVHGISEDHKTIRPKSYCVDMWLVEKYGQWMFRPIIISAFFSLIEFGLA